MRTSKWLWICGLSLAMPFTACKQLSPQPDPHPPTGKITSGIQPSKRSTLTKAETDRDFSVQEEKAPTGYSVSKSDGWITMRHGNNSAPPTKMKRAPTKGSSDDGASFGGAVAPKSYPMGGYARKEESSRFSVLMPSPKKRYKSKRAYRKARPAAMEKMAEPPPPVRTTGGAMLKDDPSTAEIAVKSSPVIAQPALKAGETNDNENFDAYLAYYHKNKHLLPTSYQIDVSERYTFHIEDKTGRSLPNCRIVVSDENDRMLWQGRTDAFGKMHFFPRVAHKDKQTAKFLVSFLYNGQSFVRTFPRNKTGNSRPWKVELPVKKHIDKVRLDLLFLLDTTGSMSDEIARIQQTLLAITAKINNKKQDYELRYGMVLYRDRTDEYVTRLYPFTQDVQAFDRALKQVSAAGGGDNPEAMNMGLYAAVEKMRWTPNALRLAFLVADAPPHMDYGNDIPYTKTLQSAVSKGIKIYPTAASGLDAQGTFVMRQIAQFTNANFLFIEYGSGTAASHGITTPHESNNLDDIIVRIVQKELKAYTR